MTDEKLKRELDQMVEMAKRQAAPKTMHFNLPGFRTPGRRKLRLVDQLNWQLASLAARGVNVKMLVRLLDIDYRNKYERVTTKEMSGLLGRVETFRRENNV